MKNGSEKKISRSRDADSWEPEGPANFDFWVVTVPTRYSELGDICFETDPAGMVLQGAGGLKKGDIVGWFLEEGDARMVANRLLGAMVKLNHEISLAKGGF